MATGRALSAALLTAAFLTTAAAAQDARPPRADTLADLHRTLLRTCRDPRLEATGIGLTLRFALGADGGLIGRPVVIKVEAPPGAPIGARFYRAEAEAILAACTPVAMSAGLGRAVAGRPLVLHVGAGRGHPPRRDRERTI